MSIKVSLKDGQGTAIEACVKKVGTLDPKEQALCVNISGTSPGQSVTTSDSAAGGQTDRFLSLVVDGVPDGVTFNAAINGTVGSPQIFEFRAIANFDYIITDIIFSGIDVSIKINNWLGQNMELTDPCLLDIKADNDFVDTKEFFRTRDIASWASLAGFDLFSEQGGDMALGFRQYKPLLVLRSQNTFGALPGSDDFVRWTVQDDHSGLTEIRIELRCFLVEPGTV